MATKRQKTGGRQKGTPNKITSDLRQVLQIIITSEIQNLASDLSQLSTKEKIDAIIKLLPFVLPKMDSIEITYQENELMNLPLIEFFGTNDT
jgi:hypothetical protein